MTSCLNERFGDGLKIRQERRHNNRRWSRVLTTDSRGSTISQNSTKKKMKMHLFAVGGLVLVLTVSTMIDLRVQSRNTATPAEITSANGRFRPIPDFVESGMVWLAEAQAENGGWGAGSHARQDIRDPESVQVDPATTAFSAMALLRSGSTLSSGPYRRNLAKALDYLLIVVDEAPVNGPRLVPVSGTQPQVKLGQNIDVSMVTQFLSEILRYTRHDEELHNRVAWALDSCLHKLELAQDADGSWNSEGGWAGVLQSAMANNALEVAEAVGRDVDSEALKRSRQYQKDNLDETSGEIRTDAAAGVSLYAIASNQRATAQEAKKAEDAVIAGSREGELPASAPVSAENLAKVGYSEDDARRLADAYDKNKAAATMLSSDAVLSGCGNNGGEEFLSYRMTSESLVVAESEEWDDWYMKMHQRLSKIQNGDGSWSGHHCITSPVFCTAAVILTMTADRAAVAAELNG
jgi:hypothetical protein